MTYAFRAWVVGKVQGVYFRANTARQAQALNIAGYAKNLDDGRVEVHAEGDKAALTSLLTWLEQGPQTAHVEQLNHKEVDVQGYSEFTTA
ncbi:acylphosphate phosphohydrolase, putative [Pseudoalteromonas sp. SW0106-04]|uniref:acylphosphatase n=1 Tax=Pseudoalteromonas sp. SW0106-04 TaxID=1702169 RepID=UPI0006C31801|nr:acylphosphatase [Pseudoalteromonas sp. SW0106-04]GAP76682.1 acylphosphate phosphohydrolase, putative [Pseudoalteromonas sp. SW0106-04]